MVRIFALLNGFTDETRRILDCNTNYKNTGRISYKIVKPFSSLSSLSNAQTDFNLFGISWISANHLPGQ